MTNQDNLKRLANVLASGHLAEAVSYGLPIAKMVSLLAEEVAQAHKRPATSEMIDHFTTLMALQPTAEARALLDVFKLGRTAELFSHEEAAYLVGLAIGAAVRGQL
jgi:aminoglycoside phosphotransferase family enzyme